MMICAVIAVTPTAKLLAHSNAKLGAAAQAISATAFAAMASNASLRGCWQSASGTMSRRPVA